MSRSLLKCVETVWGMIPEEFRESMGTYARENQNQVRYVLNTPWLIEAIREANPLLADYFSENEPGRQWFINIIAEVKSKLQIS
jgi:hypothetical protein